MVTCPAADDNGRVRWLHGARRMVLGGMLAGVLVAMSASPALSCSPPFDPSIEALGPAQLVVVGTTGERVERGRLFHVERWFNGAAPMTPIVIAFKEGEPIGDCSYPVAAGMHLIIAPMRLEDGSLYADLGTLQADPATEQGRAFVAEAEQLFGPGLVPVAAGAGDDPGADPIGPLVLGLVVGGAIGLVAAIAVGVRRRHRPP